MPRVVKEKRRGDSDRDQIREAGQEPQPMEIDKPQETRGRSRTRSRKGTRIAKTPPADPIVLTEIEDEDKGSPVTVKKRISKIEKQAKEIEKYRETLEKIASWA